MTANGMGKVLCARLSNENQGLEKAKLRPEIYQLSEIDHRAQIWGGARRPRCSGIGRGGGRYDGYASPASQTSTLAAFPIPLAAKVPIHKQYHKPNSKTHNSRTVKDKIHKLTSELESVAGRRVPPCLRSTLFLAWPSKAELPTYTLNSLRVITTRRADTVIGGDPTRKGTLRARHTNPLQTLPGIEAGNLYGNTLIISDSQVQFKLKIRTVS